MEDLDIIEASRQGRIDIVSEMIDNCVDVNYTSETGETPLSVAITHGHKEIAELLLKNNAKPIYQNKDATIKSSDALAFLKELESDSVDLILTDPPYQISKETGFSKGGGVERFAISMDFGAWDYDFKGMDEVIKEYYRVLKKGGTLIIFYDLWKISFLAENLKLEKFKQLRFLEWVKTNPVPINSKINYLTNAREIALSAVKGGKPVFNSKYDNGIYKHPIYHGKDRTHPTQKSLKLFEELILKHSNPGDLVLDSFLGSGTTACAAVNTGRMFIGSEIDAKMFLTSSLRVAKNIKK